MIRPREVLAKLSLPRLTIFLTICGVLVVATLSWRTLISLTGFLTEHELEEQRDQVALLAGATDKTLASMFSAMETMAPGIGDSLGEQDATGLDGQLQSLYASLSPLAKAVAVVDRRGDTVRTAPASSIFPGIGQEPFFLRLLSGGGRETSGALETAGGEVYLALAVPLKDRGALVSLVDVDRLVQALAGSAVTYRAFLLDRDGVVASQQWPSAEYRQQDHIVALQTTLFTERMGTTTCYSCHPSAGDREAHTLTFASLRQAPSWVLAAMKPESVAAGAVAMVQRRLAVTGIFTLSFVGLSMFLLSWLVSIRLKILSHSSRRIAQGRLNESVPLMGQRDEIGALAADFETMRQNLKTQYESIELKVAERTRELSALLAIDRVLARGLPLVEVVHAALREVAEAVNADIAAMWLSTSEGQPELAGYYQVSEGAASLAHWMKIGQALAGQAMQAKRPLATDISPYSDGSDAALSGKGTIGITPMTIAQQVSGAVAVGRRSPRAFKDDELAILQSVATQLAISYENRRLEESLVQAGEQRHRKLMESANDAIFVSDIETGLITECNQKASDLLGLPIEKIIGMPRSQLHPPDQAAFFQEKSERAAPPGEPLLTNVEVVRRDGRTVWVDISASTYTIGGKRYTAGIFRDVTLRRIAEQKLKDERDMLEAIIASMGEGLIVVDTNRRMVYCNRQVEQLLGIRGTDFVGQSVDVFYDYMENRMVEPRDWRKVVRETFVEAGTPLVRTTFRVHSPEVKDIQATLFTVGVGTRVGSGAVLRDITSEREVDRMKTEFISIASHELRTPMAGIYGFAELLLNSKSLPLEEREYARWIYQESQRLNNIVEDLLNVSRIEMGRLSVNLRPLAVEPLLAEIINKVKGRFPAHSFRLQVPAGFPETLADEDRLMQVMYNLIDNAGKYSPAGREVTVSARVDESRKEAVLAVADQGIGIPEEDLPRLFQRFYRVRRDNETVRGTGLGLYIARSLVEMMKGRIWVESKVNEGSTFFVSLSLQVGSSK